VTRYLSYRTLSRVRLLGLALPLCLLIVATGCKHFRHEKHDKVYVVGRKMVLHDRVAAVSSRVAEVQNGQELEVLEHSRRFYKVKTAKNEIGWIEERLVIDGNTHQAFDDLSTKYKDAPSVATATLRDDVYLHLTPGRNTDRFYLLAGNAKVQLLKRASVVKSANSYAPPPKPKPVEPNPAAKPEDPQKQAAQNAAKPAAPAAQTAAKAPANSAKPGEATPAVEPPPPPPLEDWWLIRDSQGRVGWLLAGRLDVDVPDEITLFGEGQKIVSAFVLNKVIDPESQSPNHEVPQYLVMMASPHSGLPYDYDQVRVFTWSLKRHRYETAFRLKPIQGFLPIKIYGVQTPKGQVPGFSFVLDNAQSSWLDAQTGEATAKQPRTISYALVDTQVKRTGPDMGPLPVSHQDDDKKNAKDTKKNGKDAAKKKK